MSVVNVNINNFENEIKNSEKPVLLDFYANWCAPCRMIAPIVEEVAEENPDILVGKINVDESPELARDFGVVSIPLLVVLRDGEIVEKAVGARGKIDILKLLGK